MGFDQISAELVSWWGTDRDVANQAWASSTDRAKLAGRSDEDVRRVVTQVARQHHDSPKRRLFMDFFLTCPIFVERQFDKYTCTVQGQDFQVEFLEAKFGRDLVAQNELSGRYRTIPDRLYKTPSDVCGVLDKACLPTSDLDSTSQFAVYRGRLSLLKEAEIAGRITNAEYRRTREVLRGSLPLSTLTDMRIVLNMDAFEHMMNQRLAAEAQLEARVLAYRMFAEVEQKNVATELLRELVKSNGWGTHLAEIDERLSEVSLKEAA